MTNKIKQEPLNITKEMLDEMLKKQKEEIIELIETHIGYLLISGGKPIKVSVEEFAKDIINLIKQL